MSDALILKTGDVFPDLAKSEGDFADWIGAGLGLPAGQLRLLDPRTGAPLPPVSEVAGVVITGSPDMVTDAPSWHEPACEWLRSLVRDAVPVLGICYGHQLLAHAFGGEVGWNPLGREVGTVEVRKTQAADGDELLAPLPAAFPAHTSHRQSVIRLPGEAVPLAESDRDPVQAFRIGERAWGVQFHPEFREAVMHAYVRRNRDGIVADELDPEEIHANVRPSDAGRVLERFGEWLAGRNARA